MAQPTQKSTGVLDRAAAAAGGISRRTLAWGGLALGAIILLAVNLIASSALRDARVDLTRERLYTISEGTRKALRAIDEPVDVRVYFSKALGKAAPAYARSFERVRTLLEQYRDIARGKLQVAFLDPEPFSDAEDRAVAAGLKGIRLNQEGEIGYFGIVGSNSTDTESNLPFLSTDRERFLEYDVTKLIVTLANQTRNAIGLISGIPIEGSPGNPMMGRPPGPPLLMLEQIREFFELRSIAKDAKEIPADIGVLMVVQPEGLSPDTAYAIDQFALSGGKVLAFVDPVAETQRQGNPMMMMMQGPPDFSEFDKLLKAWGVVFDPKNVVGDISRARRVQFGGGARASVTDYVLWLELNRRNLDERDPLAGGIDRLNLASVGFLEKAPDATTQFAPIIRTTADAMQIPAESVSMMPDAVGLLRNYKRGGNPLVLAARVSGDAKSAFPDGPPPAAPEAKSEDDKTKPPGAKAPAAAPEKKSEAAAPPRAKQVTAGNINVVVVADTDFLGDQFWVEVREFLGQQVAIPNAHNAAFVLGALENLSGSDALISLRGRGISDRPFELVAELRRDAEERFRNKEQVLTAKLRDVQTKLAGLEKQSDGENLVLTDKDRQEIEKFRGDMLSVRRELREVKRELRKDIDRLDGVLKFANIAAVPLLIGFAGIGWAAYRRRRTPAPPPKAPESLT
ncbi:MAG: Gldg family protein [Pseudomonadota bacterium]|nr:Gldg family protein [Pseudomonadota bacterium]